MAFGGNFGDGDLQAGLGRKYASVLGFQLALPPGPTSCVVVVETEPELSS